eukprot:TRINITY_DN1555_c0_g1_i1.p2 TRINITY_DN1555_c0_g1~~TRINITY_DN1555_c0_g1_i1.p2  ORF type:complete len:313 (+),score=43.73 TRINITY_DN1555_c0_g1_i1:85-939(+)
MAARPLTRESRASALGWGDGTEQYNPSGMAYAQLGTEAPDGPAQPRGTSSGPETAKFRLIRWEAHYPIGWSVGESMHITQITYGRPAWASGLMEGMRILEVNGKPVHSVAAVESAVAGRTEFDLEVGLGRWPAAQGGVGLRNVCSINMDYEFQWDPTTGETAEMTLKEGPGGGPREGERAQGSPAPSGRTAHSPSPSPSPDSPARSLSPPPASPRSGSSCKRAGPEGSPTGRNGAASPGGRCTSPLLSPAAPQRNPGSRLVAITRYLRACAACCPCDTDSAQSQ